MFVSSSQIDADVMFCQIASASDGLWGEIIIDPIQSFPKSHHAMPEQLDNPQNVKSRENKTWISNRIAHPALGRLHGRLMCHRLRSLMLIIIIIKDLLLGRDHVRELTLLPPEAAFLPSGLHASVPPLFLTAAAPSPCCCCRRRTELLGTAASGVVARLVAMIRDPEPAIDADDDIGQHDDDLDAEIEDVEARLALIRGRVRARSRPARVVDARAEGGAEAEQRGRDEQDADLVPPPAGAEFFRPLADAGQEEDADEDDGDGEEGDDGVEGLAVQGDGAIDVFGVGVEGVEGLHDGGDEHDERQHDEDVGGDEGPVGEFVPAQVRVGGAEDALGEDEVDDEDEDDAGGDEDLRRDGDGYVGRVAGPDDAHDLGDDAGHAEAEEHAGHDEFVAAPPVRLEDEHVRDGAAEEEDEEDGADGDVDALGG